LEELKGEESAENGEDGSEMEAWASTWATGSSNKK
jgi:hypothetical protein